jgi:hypothetical protein
VKTDEDKDAYIKWFLEREGIQLEKDKIEFNPGLRSLSKLMLNSFWGKFGQRSNLGQVEYIDNAAQFNHFICDETKNISSCIFVSDSLVQIQWSHEQDFIDIAPNTNVFVAAYTTAQARLKLYSYLEKLNERVLYFDTDSVIYSTKPGEAQLELGDALGELTDELGGGFSIDEFASGGPKNYAYKTRDMYGNIVGGCCKVKGISLNSENAKIVNFDSLKDLIIGGDPTKEYVLSERRIARNKDHTVVTKTQTKTWRKVYTKRRVLPDYSTVPWGYK